MKMMATTLGCDDEYGERKVVVEDEQIGAIAIREIEIESLDELVELAEDVDRVEVESTKWTKYDAAVTFICEQM